MNSEVTVVSMKTGRWHRTKGQKLIQERHIDWLFSNGRTTRSVFQKDVRQGKSMTPKRRRTMYALFRRLQIEGMDDFLKREPHETWVPEEDA